MSGVAHLCRAARGVCAQAQRRPVPWDSCPPIATACVVAIPEGFRGPRFRGRPTVTGGWTFAEIFIIDDRSLVDPLCDLQEARSGVHMLCVKQSATAHTALTPDASPMKVNLIGRTLWGQFVRPPLKWWPCPTYYGNVLEVRCL